MDNNQLEKELKKLNNKLKETKDSKRQCKILSILLTPFGFALGLGLGAVLSLSGLKIPFEHLTSCTVYFTSFFTGIGVVSSIGFLSSMISYKKDEKKLIKDINELNKKISDEKQKIKEFEKESKVNSQNKENDNVQYYKHDYPEEIEYQKTKKIKR